MDLMDMWRLIYQDELPNDIQPIMELLQTYCNIPSDQITGHLHSIRSKAWAASRTPCVGRWRFLYNMPPSDVRYKQALSRLKSVFSRDILLDLGCGMGQALRQLINDGVPSNRLLGTDVDPDMIDIGMDLFCDREESTSSNGFFSARRSGMGSRFVVADFLNDCDSGIKFLNGKATIIHASNFWHMFPWHQQIDIAVRLVSMLKPGTQNAMIYGRQIGKLKAESPTITTSLDHDYYNLDDPQSPQSISSCISSISSTFDSEVAPFSDTSSLASSISFSLPSETDTQRAFLHNRETLQLMWDIVGERTLTKWTVEMEFVSKTMANIPGFGHDSHVVHYGVYQTR